MELFSFSASGKPLLLSASENVLFLHPVHNERFGRPVLLCSNYKNGLSGCVYNDSLYYTYINKENSLLLRRLRDSSVLFRLDGTDSVTYYRPQLIVFNNALFLFYLEETPEFYRFKLRLPFADVEPQLPEPFQTTYSEPPFLFLQTTEQYLYLFLTTGATSLSYRYSGATGFEPLCSEEALLSKLRLPWESKKKQLEQGLMHALRLSEQHQNLLTEKEQELRHIETRLSERSSEAERVSALLSETSSALQTAKVQLAEHEQRKQQTEQKLEHTSLLLERAKVQYNELMQVAEQYRQEAMKWYGKFTDRN